ncbi:MAG: hypothetical protein ABSG51_11600 [Terracidiphilus sp.]
MRRFGKRVWIGAGLGLAFAGLVSCAQLLAQAQAGAVGMLADPLPQGKERVVPEVLPAKPSIPPAFTIPAEPLGYTAPNAEYMGMRWSFASLDFLSEDRLLFTFRVPGLIHREPGDRTDQRQIRAVVLALPTGLVEGQTTWPVHDRARYLWMLNDGHFLLRDRDGLELGDATLEMKPFLHFPGPVLWLQLDPRQQYLVTNSREPVAATPKSGDVAGPASAAANVSVEGQTPPGQPDMVLRILRRDSGQVMLVSRVASAVRLPLNSNGYLEGLRGNGYKWMLNLNYFNGGSRILGHVDSACAPTYDFVSEREVLVTACESWGGHRLVAMDTDGHHLWDFLASGSGFWPQVINSADGLRIARETLVPRHSGAPYEIIDSDDVRGQLVRVFDAANGKVVLEVPAVPALDAGGNVAISPSGRRVAVLSGGAIQVFDLPAPAPLPEAAASQADTKQTTSP